jgi:hypothetical protein
MNQLSVAVVGAGMSGAACADALARAGAAVTIFDKGRGPGGRMSTRRADTGHRFDHGSARFMPASSTGKFADVVKEWADAGVVLRKSYGGTEWFVGAGGMNAVCKHLVSRDCITQRMSAKIARLVREPAKWTLVDDANNPYVDFDAVVLTIPAPQAFDLVPLQYEVTRERIASIRMKPSWVAMFGFASPVWPEQADHFIVQDDHVGAFDVRRSLANTVAEAWVVQANGDWSQTHLELDAKDVLHRLARVTQSVFGARWKEPAFASAHRWRYAFVDEPLGESCMAVADDRLIVAGDWCLGWNVEAAWTSGREAANIVLKETHG